MSGLLQFGIRLDRERLVTLLARLGDPHKSLRCVHVAGTNGKGSTTTFIAAILRAAGFRVGAYLSPYVFDLRERIQINGEMIPPEDFARWVTTIRPHVEALEKDGLGQTTEFELKTVVAFCWFAERNVDFAALEVGIGGRLDATNVIPPPLAAVITSIGLDHVKILGDTLAKIAGEKAGIIKSGTAACVTAVPPGEALDAIREAASAQNVPLLRVVPAGSNDAGEAFVTYDSQTAPDGRTLLTLNLPERTLTNLRLSLRGPFQTGNAAAAAGAVEVLRRCHDVSISDDALRQGLERAALPGRFQIARQETGTGAALVLDGAHNDDGARVLAEALRSVFPDRRFVFVMGMRSNHDPEPFLRIVRPLASRLIATVPPFKPQPAEEIAAAAKRLGLPATIAEPAAAAIRQAWNEARASGEVVVVTGSFYVVGETPEDLRGGG